MLEPLVGKIPWGRERLPTPVFWPGEFHGPMGSQSRTGLNDFHLVNLMLIIALSMDSL